MNCCANCFGDSFIEAEIEFKSTLTNKCSYCEKDNQKLIEPILLNSNFEIFLDIYTESDEGESLVRLLKNDWLLFPTLDEFKAQSLLTEVYNDGEIIRKKYRRIYNTETPDVENWELFRSELMFENRYFPKNIPNLERLAQLLVYLEIVLDTDRTRVYRSRRDPESNLTLNDLGKPPRTRNSSGRANPPGIQYLYTASDIATAISEIRPHKGDIIAVAEFKLESNINLIDLRNPRKSISPFRIIDEELEVVFTGIKFLTKLGEELSNPVIPDVAHLEYLSTQYLCELIKNLGYQGVAYKSSVSDGTNFAFFDDSHISPINISKHEISDINIEFNSK